MWNHAEFREFAEFAATMRRGPWHNGRHCSAREANNAISNALGGRHQCTIRPDYGWGYILAD